MKKILFLISLVLSVNLLSCQDDQVSNVSDTLLKKIAMDKDYIAYQKMIKEIGYHVATKSWDMDSIINLLSKYPGLNSTCEVPISDFEVVKNGKLYQDLHCKMDTYVDKIDKKYNYRDLSEIQMIKIRAFYKENIGDKDDEELRNKILQYQNRN